MTTIPRHISPRRKIPGDPLSVGDPLVQLAPGVLGVAVEHDGCTWYPAIVAEREGAGDVGRWLDSLPATARIPCVTSVRLRGMLKRRGWRDEWPRVPEINEFVDVWRRR